MRARAEFFEAQTRAWSVAARNRLSAFWSIAQCDLPASCWNAKSALTKERTDGHRQTHGNPKVRESRHTQNDRLGVRESTTDMVAPTAQARCNRDVEHFPRQCRTAKRAGRPQPPPQLQHSNGQCKVQGYGLFRRSRSDALYVQSRSRIQLICFQQSAKSSRHFREYFAPANSTMPC